MDTVRGFDEDRRYLDDEEDTVIDVPRRGIGGDERRMHVRVYNHWVSLLRDRAYPSIEDLDPAGISDFGPHSVLLDFSRGVDDPEIAFLGRALREECELDHTVTQISQVPSRSLLSRLTDHYRQIIANRAPIGFEAEFVGSRGHNTMYRGILMPFSSNQDTINFVYGVINWKELVDADMQTTLNAEVEASVRAAPRVVATAPAWADGPLASQDDTAAIVDEANIDDAINAPPDAGHGDSALGSKANLAEQLIIAQQSAAAAHAAHARGRATLYRALGRAYDFAAAADQHPQAYEMLLNQAGIAVQLRAPMTPITKLIFAADDDETRLSDYETVLSHARRIGIHTGELGAFLESVDGGITGVVAAERALRQPAGRSTDYHKVLQDRPSIAQITLDAGIAAGDYVVLLARGGANGALDVVATFNDAALTDTAMRVAAV